MCAGPISDDEIDAKLVADSPIYDCVGDLDEILLAHVSCAEFENQRYFAWHHDRWCDASSCRWCAKNAAIDAEAFNRTVEGI